MWDKFKCLNIFAQYSWPLHRNISFGWKNKQTNNNNTKPLHFAMPKYKLTATTQNPVHWTFVHHSVFGDYCLVVLSRTRKPIRLFLCSQCLNAGRFYWLKHSCFSNRFNIGPWETLRLPWLTAWLSSVRKPGNIFRRSVPTFIRS